MTDVDSALLADLDQHQAAMRWTQGLFPQNVPVGNNARIDELIRLTLATAQDRVNGDANLIVPSREVVLPLAPDADVVGALRATAPTYAVCDYCDRGQERVASLLPLVAPPNVIAFPLCDECTYLLQEHFQSAQFISSDTPTGGTT